MRRMVCNITSAIKTCLVSGRSNRTWPSCSRLPISMCRPLGSSKVASPAVHPGQLLSYTLRAQQWHSPQHDFDTERSDAQRSNLPRGLSAGAGRRALSANAAGVNWSGTVLSSQRVTITYNTIIRALSGFITNTFAISDPSAVKPSLISTTTPIQPVQAFGVGPGPALFLRRHHDGSLGLPVKDWGPWNLDDGGDSQHHPLNGSEARCREHAAARSGAGHPAQLHPLRHRQEEAPHQDHLPLPAVRGDEQDRRARGGRAPEEGPDLALPGLAASRC